ESWTDVSTIPTKTFMDKAYELLQRLRNKEDNFTERKPRGVKRDEMRRTIVAFANSVPESQSGVLYIGVLNDGTIQGLDETDSLQKTIRDICERDCYPAIKFRSVSLGVEGKGILAVELRNQHTRTILS